MSIKIRFEDSMKQIIKFKKTPVNKLTQFGIFLVISFMSILLVIDSNALAATNFGNAVAADLLSGKTATSEAGSITGTIPNKIGSGTTITPGITDQIIPRGYYGGTLADGKVTGDANLIASNIMSGKSIFGVAGTYGGVTITSHNATATFTQTTYPWGHTWFTETISVADADKVAGVYVNSTCCGYFGTDVIAMNFTKVSATQISVSFNTATQAANNINVNYVVISG